MNCFNLLEKCERQLAALNVLGSQAGISTRFENMKREQRFDLYNFLRIKKETWHIFVNRDEKYDNMELAPYVDLFHRAIWPNGG